MFVQYKMHVIHKNRSGTISRRIIIGSENDMKLNRKGYLDEKIKNIKQVIDDMLVYVLEKTKTMKPFTLSSKFSIIESCLCD